MFASASLQRTTTNRANFFSFVLTQLSKQLWNKLPTIYKQIANSKKYAHNNNKMFNIQVNVKRLPTVFNFLSYLIK
jgi:hypothetical protein